MKASDTQAASVFDLEHVRCDFCAGERYRTRYRKPDTWLWLTPFAFPVVECLDCGLVYVNPRPTERAMARCYPASFYEKRSEAAFLAKYAVQMEYIPRLTNERVLDIGCADGDWLLFLKKAYPGISCVGVDNYHIPAASDMFEFHPRPLPECGFAPAQFDLVTAWAVWEHVHHPSDYFQAVAHCLKPGRSFVFLVTNSESIYGRRAYKEDLPRHLYHFSEKTLRAYAERFGFEFAGIHYDDRIHDGRGDGMFYYALMSLLGVDWETIRLKRVGALRTQIGRIGRFLDRIAFRGHWEAARKRSGIIICEFIRK
jgi:2-polyprenyl-3-methyl-5-hydroxy-6-metoxy-1,4-benzoquinol methylase